MSPTARSKAHRPFLPKIEDLLGLIEEWCRLTGVSKSELAGKVLDLDRSAVTQVFKRRRKLLYEEAQSILDYLAERLSPLPSEPISTIAPKPKDVIAVQSTITVEQAATELVKGNFTQIPVFDGQNFVGLVTDRMILERLLNPNRKFTGTWMDTLRKMTVKEAGIIETSAAYPMDASVAAVADALSHIYAVMLMDNGKFSALVTRWDYLKLLMAPEHSR